MFYSRQKLRFKCTGCGACCKGNERDHYIAASGREQERIRLFLGLSKTWFRRRYIVKVDDTIESVRIEEEGQCVFLDRMNRCRIYPARPNQCRTYPFWPEVVNKRSDWQAEAGHCEGIGRGDVIPIARIESAIKKCCQGA